MRCCVMSKFLCVLGRQSQIRGLDFRISQGAHYTSMRVDINAPFVFLHCCKSLASLVRCFIDLGGHFRATEHELRPINEVNTSVVFLF